MMKKLVQWGAGNIGRSFIGQIFARCGYEVTFIDIDKTLIELLNRSRCYRVVTVSQEGESIYDIKNIRAVYAGDEEEVQEAVREADLLSVSVGKDILGMIAGQLARCLLDRYAHRPECPLDVIIAENIHHGAKYLTELLTPLLPESFPLKSYLGLVETSIGKMVPIQTGNTPLIMTAEPYNTLIADRDGFINPVPECRFLQPVSPIQAYVERKMYIHNLGHAAAAYLGYAAHPDTVLLADVLEDADVMSGTLKAMKQASLALSARFPDVFSEKELHDHIEDLLNRFCNRVLGDTVYRVGRDILRKLRYDDRLMGAILMAYTTKVDWDAIGAAYCAGLSFRARSPEGELFDRDQQCIKDTQGLSLMQKLRYVSALDTSGYPPDVIDSIIAKLAQICRRQDDRQ